MEIEYLIVFFAIFGVKNLLSKPHRNILFNVSYARSSDFEMGTLVTDGIIGPNSVEVLKDCAGGQFYIEFVFAEKTRIEEIIMWLGYCANCDDKAFDNFIVFLTNYETEGEDSNLEYCGRSVPPNNSMRIVSHIKPKEWFLSATIENARGFYYSGKIVGVSEVQMTELSFKAKTFYGCFGYYNIGAVKDMKAYDECKLHCYELSHWFFVLKNDSCLCSSIAPKNKLDIWLCGKPCDDDPEEFCPHDDTEYYPIFIAKSPMPKFYGCFTKEDNLKLDLKMEFDKLTPIKCIIHCSKHRKFHAYLFNSKECYCGDDLPSKKVYAWHCDLLCSGYPEGPKTCGGNNSYSVFTGCVEMKDQSPCYKIFKCEHGNIDEYGICQGKCNTGWAGIRCLDYVMKNSSIRPLIIADDDVYFFNDTSLEHQDINESVYVKHEQIALPDTKVLILLTVLATVSIAVYYVILRKMDNY